MKKFLRSIGRRLLEPSTSVALALLTQLLGASEILPVGEAVINGVTGVLIALGVIQPEMGSKEEE